MSLYIGDDMDVTLTGMQDAISLVYLNTATATYELKRGTTVIDSGTLDYVAASDGDYLAVIDSAITANLTQRTNYSLVITFVQGNYQTVRYLTEAAYYRGGT